MVSYFIKLRQQGTAVITALMMVAVASAIAVALMSQQRINIRRTEQLITAQQSYFLSDGALYWAKALLSRQNLDNIQWPAQLPETSVLDGQGRVRAELTNTKNLINLNNIDNQDSVNKFSELMREIEGIDDSQIEAVVNAIKAWISKNAAPGYDEQYLSLAIPYRAAHQLMISKTELRQVLGVTPKMYQHLQKSITTLPAANNDSYLLHTGIELQDQILNVYTILHRSVDQGKVSVQVAWQSRGTW